MEMDFSFKNLRRMIRVGVALGILVQIWKMEIRYRPREVDHRPGWERVVEGEGRNRSQGRGTFTIAVFYKCTTLPSNACVFVLFVEWDGSAHPDSGEFKNQTRTA